MERHPPTRRIRAPAGLMAVAVGGHVILAWAENGSDGLGFRIQRAAGVGPGCSFLDVGGVGHHVAAFCDASVKPHSTYSYRVHAWNASGASSPSNVAEVTTPLTAADPTAE